jgi:uncharacterized protein (DUF58 family)
MVLTGMTARGRAFLAAGITSTAAGVILDQRDLVRIGILLLALPLTAGIFLTRARYRIAADRRLDRTRAPVGSVVRVELEVSNASRLTTPLLLAQDTLPPELGFATGAGARFVLARIPAGQQSTVSYPVRPVQRGRYTIGPLSVRLADPFGFCQILRTFSATSHLCVLPEIVPLPAGRLGGQWSAGGDSRQQGITTGGEQDVTTRPYRPGDDRRRVHWRTTARTGELSVRREEQPWQSQATILVDTRGPAHSPGTPSGSFEYAISAAASIAAALVRAGYGLRLIDGLARVVAESTSTPGEAGFAVMDALCDLPRSTSTTLLPVATRLGAETNDPGSIIAVLGHVTPGDTAALARAAHRSARCLALLVDAEAWTPGGQGRDSSAAGTGRDALRRAGWSVAVARQGTPIDRVWQELNAVDPSRMRRWVG